MLRMRPTLVFVLAVPVSPVALAAAGVGAVELELVGRVLGQPL